MLFAKKVSEIEEGVATDVATPSGFRWLAEFPRLSRLVVVVPDLAVLALVLVRAQLPQATRALTHVRLVVLLVDSVLVIVACATVDEEVFHVLNASFTICLNRHRDPTDFPCTSLPLRFLVVGGHLVAPYSHSSSK